MNCMIFYERNSEKGTRKSSVKGFERWVKDKNPALAGFKSLWVVYESGEMFSWLASDGRWREWLPAVNSVDGVKAFKSLAGKV